MKRIILMLIMLIMLIPISIGLDWCGIEVSKDTMCTEVTPVLATCDPCNVTIYNASFINTQNATLIQIGLSGTYQFNFTGVDFGVHKWIAHDNTSGTINVRTELREQLNSNVSRILNNMSASVEIINSNTTAELDLILTNVSLSVGVITTNVSLSVGVIKTNISLSTGVLESSISSVNTSVADINTSIMTQINLINGSIITHGDVNWTTASNVTATINTTAIAVAVWERNATFYENVTTWRDTFGNFFFDMWKWGGVC